MSIPYPRLNSQKTIPFTAANTHIVYIGKCSFAPPAPDPQVLGRISPTDYTIPFS